MNLRKQIERILDKSIWEALDTYIVSSGYDFNKLQEIRIRCLKVICIKLDGQEYIINHRTTLQQINNCIEYMTEYSLFSMQDSISKGFITVEGGHRVGVFGKAIINQKNIVGQTGISFLNIRIAHEINGCSDNIFREISIKDYKNTLVASAPGCGKTTLIRDMVRNLSDYGYNVSLIDERSEIAGSILGIPQFDIGMRTDVFDACPKTEGMIIAVRSMSPDIIAVDEIGSDSDLEAVSLCMNCGCRILATIHAATYEELLEKKKLKPFISPTGFSQIIMLSKRKGPGCVDDIIKI